MHTTEPLFTIEETQRMVKNLYSSYAKEELEYVAANATHVNAEERTDLPGVFKDFEEFFSGALR